MGRWATLGAVGGVLGGLLMITYAMVVSFAYKDVGFFTPLYHIGTTFSAPDAMMASMEAAMGGSGFHFEAGPAALGFIVHILTGAVAGALFGALVSLWSLGRGMTVAAGAIFGIVVMLGNAYIGLPIVAEVFGGGEPIADMPSMAGWGTFTAEHLIFGVVLGAVLAATSVRDRRHDGKAERPSSVASSS